MKTSEFKEQMGKIAYVEDDGEYLKILMSDGLLGRQEVARICKYGERMVNTIELSNRNTDLKARRMFDIIIEYAKTPTNKREDEKKFKVYLDLNSISKYRDLESKTELQKNVFTESELEDLKQRDDIPIDWSKVKLIEVDDGD